MEGQCRGRDLRGREAIEQRLVEMKAGRGRCHRARFTGPYRLVALVVERVGGMRDVWRQRKLAHAVKHLVYIFIEFKRVQIVAASGYSHRHAIPVAFELDDCARLRRMAGAHLRARGTRAFDPLDHHFDASAGVLASEQTRLDHARVIEYEQISGSKPSRQFSNTAVLKAFAGSRDQKSTGGALRQRRLRDQLVGELEIEIGPAHGDGLANGIAVMQFTKRKSPDQRSGLLHKSLTITYFHKRAAHYHRRRGVSRSCSGWEGVVPPCYGHQA